MAKYESGRLYTTPRLQWEMPWHKTDFNKTYNRCSSYDNIGVFFYILLFWLY